MRATRRRRPRRRIVARCTGDRDLAAVAARASYEGSPEHKDTPSFAGPPRRRPDATLCDRALARRRDDLDDWLRAAIRQGTVGEAWDGEFPRYAWMVRDGRCFEARLTNRMRGTYKGYELKADE